MPRKKCKLSSVYHYQLTKKLSQGRNISVHIAKHQKTRKKYIIKSANKSDSEAVESLKHESKVIEYLNYRNYPYCPQMIEWLEKSKKHHMVISYFNGYKDVNTQSPELILEFIKNLTIGIIKLHELNVYHLDLKPENIMSNSNANIKVIDFEGSSINSDLPKTYVMTRQFYDYRQDVSESEYKESDQSSWWFSSICRCRRTKRRKLQKTEILERSDKWSLAVTVYDLIGSESIDDVFPYNEKELIHIQEQILTGKYKLKAICQRYDPILDALFKTDSDLHKVVEIIEKLIKSI